MLITELTEKIDAINTAIDVLVDMVDEGREFNGAQALGALNSYRYDIQEQMNELDAILHE